MGYISFEEFKKMDIRVGTIKEIEPIPETDKLLCCQVDFGEVNENGEKKLRQIISGIREYYPEYKELIGKQILYIINIEPRKIKGNESHGMLLAVNDFENKPVFIIPEIKVDPGSRIH